MHSARPRSRLRRWGVGVLGVVLIFVLGIVAILLVSAFTGRGGFAILLGIPLMGFIARLYLMRLGFFADEGLLG